MPKLQETRTKQYCTRSHKSYSSPRSSHSRWGVRTGLSQFTTTTETSQ